MLRRLKRRDSGQAIEYVMMILFVTLFMIVAAFGLRVALSRTVSKVSSWVSTVETNTPPVPHITGSTTGGSGEDSGGDSGGHSGGHSGGDSGGHSGGHGD